MKIIYQSLSWPSLGGMTVYHPKMAVMADGKLLMTLQRVSGSDTYGPVLETLSSDGGWTWTDPEPIPPLGIFPSTGNCSEGTCDTVPDTDLRTGLTVAVGHNVFYEDGHFADTLGSWNKADRKTGLKRRGVCSVRLPDGWGPRQVFEPEEFRDCIAFCCGCAQKIVEPDGTWLIPFYFMRDPETQFNGVTVYKARFDGEKMTLLEHGTVLEHQVGRGLLEPSLIRFEGRTLLTLRAEDGRGYFAESSDGLHYSAIRPWAMDDGELIETSTTQQHWVKLNGKLFLMYVRNAGFNRNIFRFRAPLFIARVDPEKMCLIRSTERTVFPLDGDFEKPETVALSGNYMPLMLDEHTVLVSDGSSKSFLDYTGVAMLARLSE